MNIKIYLLLAPLAMCFSCHRVPDKAPEPFVMGRHLDSLSAAVACAHPAAAAVGADILHRGGNATDAAVAMQWALAVCYPQAGNIGGGGFMVSRSADGVVETLDFRERAPAAAYESMYQNRMGEVVEGISLNTRLAVGVPGTVKGIFAMHHARGSMDMAALIQPAIDMARRGFRLTASQAERLNEYRDTFESRNLAPTAFVKTNGEWKAGDLLQQPDLATTLERIRDGGEQEFYSGVTAAMITDEMQQGRGLITPQDLADYRVVWRQPIATDFGEYRIFGMPPPSSGGIAVAQLLTMAELLEVDTTSLNSAEYIHLLTEMERRVYADRSKYLGDPDFYNVPVDQLLDASYLAQRVSDIDPHRATPSTTVHPGHLQVAPESMETTHLSAVDSAGNAVSITTTLNGRFGCKIAVTGAGFFLNNEMDDFSAKPGSPNMFGLIGGEANAIAPGKRMLSSMSPIIVTKNENLFLVAGSPGGSTIITTVFQTVMNTTVFHLDLAAAIDAPRFHSQWWPDEITVETGRFEPTLLDSLQGRGHTINEVTSLGRVDAVLATPSGYQATGDPRGDDSAAGLPLKKTNR